MSLRPPQRAERLEDAVNAGWDAAEDDAQAAQLLEEHRRKMRTRARRQSVQLHARQSRHHSVAHVGGSPRHRSGRASPEGPESPRAGGGAGLIGRAARASIALVFGRSQSAGVPSPAAEPPRSPSPRALNRASAFSPADKPGAAAGAEAAGGGGGEPSPPASLRHVVVDFARADRRASGGRSAGGAAAAEGGAPLAGAAEEPQFPHDQLDRRSSRRIGLVHTGHSGRRGSADGGAAGDERGGDDAAWAPPAAGAASRPHSIHHSARLVSGWGSLPAALPSARHTHSRASLSPASLARLADGAPGAERLHVREIDQEYDRAVADARSLRRKRYVRPQPLPSPSGYLRAALRRERVRCLQDSPQNRHPTPLAQLAIIFIYLSWVILGWFIFVCVALYECTPESRAPLMTPGIRSFSAVLTVQL